MPSKILTQSYLKKIIDYNPETGIFVWKSRPLSFFKFEKFGISWNLRFSGKEITCCDAHGYIVTNIGTKSHKLHRLAWLYMTGEWPSEIDHINHKRADNRWINLRIVSHSQNSRNAKVRRDSKSGYTGVTWNKLTKKWRAKIYANQRQISLGYFYEKSDAIAARKEANIRYGYHHLHGSN